MSAETYPRVADVGEAVEESSLSSRRGIAILLLLCLVQFMDILDASILNIALPSIRADLGFSQQSLQWVINGYILTYGGFLLLGGRAADLLGRRRMLITGLLVFAGASLAGGLAQTESRARDRPVRAGLRRRDALAGGAVDADHDLPERQRPAQGARRLGRSFGAGRRRRRALRGPAHRRPGVAVGAVRQRAAERRCARRRAPPAGGRAAEEARRRGRARCVPRHRRHAAPRLHAGEGAGRRAGGRGGQSPDWRSRWPSSPPSWSTSCTSGIRSCRCRSCGPGALPSPTRPRWWRWAASSRCSSS